MKKILSGFVFSVLCALGSSLYAAAPAPAPAHRYTFEGPIRNGNNLHIIATDVAVVPPQVVGDIQQDTATGNIVLNLPGVSADATAQIRAAAIQIFARYNNGFIGGIINRNRTKIATAAAMTMFFVVYGIIQNVQLPLVPNSFMDSTINYSLLGDVNVWQNACTDARQAGNYGKMLKCYPFYGGVVLATPAALIALHCATLFFVFLNQVWR